MRIVLKLSIAAIAMTLLTPTAYAQSKGKRQQQSATHEEDAAKKKALDADYKKALNSIPDAKEKQDPWKTMR